jgi:hypothetical protein
LHRKPIVLSLAAALAACASPSTRIADELQRYGLDQGRAQCVGQSLERDLTVNQLRQLAAAAKAYQATGRIAEQLSAGDLARVAGNVRDPAVAIAVVSAGTGCGLTIADILR